MNQQSRGGSAVFRQPAPDGLKSADGSVLLVLPPGTLLADRYRVEFLEVGGMSVTYRATDEEGRRYLLKEVSSLDADRVLALSREGALLGRLDHPGIVKAHDLFEEDGYHYLVLDFVEGQRLDRLISPFPENFLQEQVVVGWGLQLCAIFDYLHYQRPPIVYRDLKPKNVIKTPEGRIRLVDFGIARVFKEGQSRDTTPMGTALTASPEHYGGKQTDARSDIYTLGATLHFLLTNGRNPAPEPFAFTPIRSINPALSETLERAIQKAVEVRPEDRFQSTRELRDALMAVRTPGAPPRTRPARAEGWTELLPGKESAPGWTTHAIFGVVILATLLVWSLWRPSSRSSPLGSSSPAAVSQHYPGLVENPPKPLAVLPLQTAPGEEPAVPGEDGVGPGADPGVEPGVEPAQPEPPPRQPWEPRPVKTGATPDLPDARYPVAARRPVVRPRTRPGPVETPAALPAARPIVPRPSVQLATERVEVPGYSGWSIVPPGGYELTRKTAEELVLTASAPDRSLRFVSREVYEQHPAEELHRRIEGWKRDGWSVNETEFHGRPGYALKRRGVNAYRELSLDPLPNGRCWLRQMEFEHHGRLNDAQAEWTRVFFSAVQEAVTSGSEPGLRPNMRP
ncbi:MAG: protein kinase [Armatimonadetes bacterium]|nr:protein kinase [Armatimonadota bacterium]